MQHDNLARYSENHKTEYIDSGPSLSPVPGPPLGPSALSAPRRKSSSYWSKRTYSSVHVLLTASFLWFSRCLYLIHTIWPLLMLVTPCWSRFYHLLFINYNSCIPFLINCYQACWKYCSWRSDHLKEEIWNIAPSLYRRPLLWLFGPLPSITKHVPT